MIDPHDRKPFFMTWFAGFPNDDMIAICEWPPFHFQDCKSSPVSDIERYRDLILEAEASLPRVADVRLIDGLFGAAIKSGRGLNIIQMLGAPCLGCLEKNKAAAWTKCKHRLSYKQAPAYSGSVRDGNILLRAHVGEAGARAKLLALDSCPNFIMSCQKYAWKENTREDRGPSEVPQMIWKDGVDTARMAMLAGFHRWPAEAPPTKMVPRRRGR